MNILKKRMTHIGLAIPKLRTPNTWLDKCLKSPVSEDSSKKNMVNGLKHCWNLHQSAFIIFIDYCHGNWVGKSLFYWHDKSWECLLAHWMPMTSILFLIGTIWRYQLRCNYLRNKKLFLKFFVLFWTLV